MIPITMLLLIVILTSTTTSDIIILDIILVATGILIGYTDNTTLAHIFMEA
jgi:general stress protein CsbA